MTAAGTTAAPLVAGESRVTLRPLAKRQDGDGWVIGRVETGDFISVPEAAHQVLVLLGEGHEVATVAARLRRDTGKNFAVASFVADLDELGFIASIDGEARAEMAVPEPSLRWLRPGHVRWLLHPAAVVTAAMCLVTVAALLATHPALVPSYRMLVWDRYPGLVLAVNAAIAWVLILVHELGHLATARAAGVPARITLSTRLQFLTAQTDVSGTWGAPRRVRMTVYLAGMAIEITLAAACLVVLVAVDPGGLARELLLVTLTESLIVWPTQFMVFMRTDLYFVLQDLTGCANLYADGSAYLRYRLRRVVGGGAATTDPSLGYPPRERLAVRWFSALLVVGTAVCLGVEFAVSLPALALIIARAATSVGTTALATLDGAALICILLAWQGLWCARWWDRHQAQVKTLAGNLRPGKGGATHGDPGPDSGGRRDPEGS